MSQNNEIRYKISNKSLIPHVLAIFFGIGIITLPIKIIKNKYTCLKVNDNYILGEIGIFNKSSQHSSINKITSVRINTTIFGRLLGYGDVIISTANGEYVYKSMDSPEKIQKHIMELMEK